MSVTLLCPKCRRPIVATDSVPTTCLQCGSELPSALVTVTEEQLRREPATKPLLLRLLPLFLGLWAIVSLPLSLIFLLSSGGTYSINDVQVTREEFMRRAGDTVIAFPVLGVFAALIAWGLYRDHPWARQSAIAFFLVAVLAPAVMFAHDPQLSVPWPVSVLTAALVGIPVGWYFYGKRSVVRYYARNGASRETGIAHRRPNQR